MAEGKGDMYPPPPQMQQPSGYPPQQQFAPPAGQTTVIIQQPQASVNIGKRNWQSGAMSCFDDMEICLCVWCNPCYPCMFTSHLGEHFCVPCCVQGWPVALRTRMRTEMGIEGSICDDCVMSAFCGPCTLCQMAREWKSVHGTHM